MRAYLNFTRGNPRVAADVNVRGPLLIRLHADLGHQPGIGRAPAEGPQRPEINELGEGSLLAGGQIPDGLEALQDADRPPDRGRQDFVREGVVTPRPTVLLTGHEVTCHLCEIRLWQNRSITRLRLTSPNCNGESISVPNLNLSTPIDILHSTFSITLR